MNVPHLGEIFSVLTAIVWAVSVVLFRMSGRRLAPLELNFFKNIVASVLLLATIVVLREPLFRAAPPLDYALLALSGIIGIALADTIFFQSLNIVGAGLSQIVSLAYGPFIIILAFVFLGERLTAGDLVGAGLITVGILLTTSHRSQPGITPHDLRKGVALATLSVALMALGVLLAKPVLDRSPVLWSTAVRLIGGVGALVVLALVSPRHRRLWATLRPGQN